MAGRQFTEQLVTERAASEQRRHDITSGLLMHKHYNYMYLLLLLLLLLALFNTPSYLPFLCHY